MVRKKFLVDFYFNDGGKYIVGTCTRSFENSNYTFKIIKYKINNLEIYS